MFHGKTKTVFVVLGGTTALILFLRWVKLTQNTTLAGALIIVVLFLLVAGGKEA